MLAEALRTLYGYNGWANDRVVVAVAQLTPEQLNAPGGPGLRSVRETLLHMMGAHRGWLSWWDGSLPPDVAQRSRPDPADYPDAASLRSLWDSIARQTNAFTAGLTDADADRVFMTSQPDGSEFRTPLWRMMIHVANHGTQHRSELAAMLTARGHSPGDLNMIFYDG